MDAHVNITDDPLHLIKIRWTLVQYNSWVLQARLRWAGYTLGFATHFYYTEDAKTLDKPPVADGLSDTTVCSFQGWSLSWNVTFLHAISHCEVKREQLHLFHSYAVNNTKICEKNSGFARFLIYSWTRMWGRIVLLLWCEIFYGTLAETGLSNITIVYYSRLMQNDSAFKSNDYYLKRCCSAFLDHYLAANFFNILLLLHSLLFLSFQVEFRYFYIFLPAFQLSVKYGSYLYTLFHE